jgi:hypothetical protein
MLLEPACQSENYAEACWFARFLNLTKQQGQKRARNTSKQTCMWQPQCCCLTINSMLGFGATCAYSTAAQHRTCYCCCCQFAPPGANRRAIQPNAATIHGSKRLGASIHITAAETAQDSTAQHEFRLLHPSTAASGLEPAVTLQQASYITHGQDMLLLLLQGLYEKQHHAAC